MEIDILFHSDHCNAPTVAGIVSFINSSQAANITILVIGLKINNSQLLMTFAELIIQPTRKIFLHKGWGFCINVSHPSLSLWSLPFLFREAARSVFAAHPSSPSSPYCLTDPLSWEIYWAVVSLVTRAAWDQPVAYTGAQVAVISCEIARINKTYFLLNF